MGFILFVRVLSPSESVTVVVDCDGDGDGDIVRLPRTRGRKVYPLYSLIGDTIS